MAGLFRFEIDGEEIPVLEVVPGRMTAEPKGANGATVEFATWRVAKVFDPADTRLADLFLAFADGTRKTDAAGGGSLVYLSPNTGTEARRIDFFGFTPIRYSPGGVDTQASGTAATEVIELRVLRCEYQ